jgi:long-subunit fatty acid transport protein
MNRFRAFALATVLLPPATSSALAQNTEDQNAFDFSLPGARSRGIGGAFVAIADDATSVYSNPAGLTLLFRPEVAIEVRRWDYTNRMPSRGHAFGPATQVGIDRIEGLVDDSFDSQTTGLSFLSFVYPGDWWAVGVFRHQLSRYRMDRQIDGPFFDCRGGFRVGNIDAAEPFCEPHAMVDGVDREFPKIQSLDFDIHSTGGAFAVDLPAARVSLGGALQFFDFSISSINTVFNARDHRKYQPADFTDPDNVELVSRQFGTDHAFAVNAGVLWNVSSQWVLGASFRQGPKFEFSTETRRGAASAAPGEIVPNPSDRPNPFRVPDTFSLGLSYRPSELWRFGVEYDRVQFHQLIDDFRTTAFYPGSPEGAVVSARMRLDDSNQIRFGGEYLLLLPGSRSLAFRGGLWYDPSHQTYFDGDPATGLPAPRWAILFPRRDGSMHYSGGIGFTTRRHFQIDAALDLSELIDTLSVSGVWRF